MKPWFSVKQLRNNIWGMAEFSHFEQVISYLIVGKKQALLFDTGMGIASIKEEVEKITSLPVVVLNSHCHFDHIGGNKEFNTTLLFNNKWSIQKASSGYSHREMKQYIGKETFFATPPVDFDSKSFKILPFQWHHTISEGTVINIDPYILRVIHTPGHSPDSICIYEETEKVLFSGDTLYPGPIYLQLPESNRDHYKRSIKKLLKLNISTVFSAHNDYEFPVGSIQKIFQAIHRIYKNTTTKEIVVENELKLLFK